VPIYKRYDNKIITIWLLGKTSSGKSTIIDFIDNYDKEYSVKYYSQTKETKVIDKCFIIDDIKK